MFADAIYSTQFLDARLGTCNAKGAIELCCVFNGRIERCLSFLWGTPRKHSFWDPSTQAFPERAWLDHIRKVFKKQWWKCDERIPPQVAGTILIPYIRLGMSVSTRISHGSGSSSSQCQTKAVFIGHPLFAGKLRWRGLYRRCFWWDIFHGQHHHAKDIRRPSQPSWKGSRASYRTDFKTTSVELFKTLLRLDYELQSLWYGRSAPVEVKWHISIAWEDASAPESVWLLALGKRFFL